MFLTLWNYLRGYVIIRVSGFSVERFINLAALRGIYIWDLHHDGTAVIMSVSLNGFRNLKECSQKTRCRYKILEKHGMPFVMDKSKRRKAYTAGIFVFVTLLYVMSSFVWTVDVKGNERVKSEDILSFCSAMRLSPGRLKSRADIENITKKLITNFKDISWVAITTEGTKVTVTVVESIPETEIKDLETPSNIAASKNCVIESISVSSGAPLVKEGDVIEEGDLLVSGELVIKDADLEVGKKYVRSIAEIYGRSTYSFEREAPLKYTEKVFTGKKEKNRSLIIGGYKINGISADVDFVSYEETGKDTKEFKIGDYILPFKFETVEYAEFYEEDLERTEEEAKNIIYEEVNKIKEEYIFNGGNIENEEINFFNTGESLKAEIELTVSEPVGKEIPLEDLRGDEIINGADGENSGY